MYSLWKIRNKSCPECNWLFAHFCAKKGVLLQAPSSPGHTNAFLEAFRKMGASPRCGNAKHVWQQKNLPVQTNRFAANVKANALCVVRPSVCLLIFPEKWVLPFGRKGPKRGCTSELRCVGLGSMPSEFWVRVFLTWIQAWTVLAKRASLQWT